MTTSAKNFMLDKGYDAGGAIIKFRGVKFSADQTVVQVTASTDLACGVAQEAVTAGEQARGKGCPVAIEGVTEAEAGAAITIGQEVMFNASGKVIPATSTNRACGQCVGSPTTADGQRTMIHLALPGRLVA